MNFDLRMRKDIGGRIEPIGQFAQLVEVHRRHPVSPANPVVSLDEPADPETVLHQPLKAIDNRSRSRSTAPVSMARSL